MRRTRAQLAVQVDAPAESYEGEEPIALDSDCLDGPPGERWRELCLDRPHELGSG